MLRIVIGKKYFFLNCLHGLPFKYLQSIYYVTRSVHTLKMFVTCCPTTVDCERAHDNTSNSKYGVKCLTRETDLMRFSALVH